MEMLWRGLRAESYNSAFMGNKKLTGEGEFFVVVGCQVSPRCSCGDREPAVCRYPLGRE